MLSIKRSYRHAIIYLASKPGVEKEKDKEK